jgi:hypothetical protein
MKPAESVVQHGEGDWYNEATLEGRGPFSRPDVLDAEALRGIIYETERRPWLRDVEALNRLLGELDASYNKTQAQYLRDHLTSSHLLIPWAQDPPSYVVPGQYAYRHLVAANYPERWRGASAQDLVDAHQELSRYTGDGYIDWKPRRVEQGIGDCGSLFNMWSDAAQWPWHRLMWRTAVWASSRRHAGASPAMRSSGHSAALNIASMAAVSTGLSLCHETARWWSSNSGCVPEVATVIARCALAFADAKHASAQGRAPLADWAAVTLDWFALCRDVLYQWRVSGYGEWNPLSVTSSGETPIIVHNADMADWKDGDGNVPWTVSTRLELEMIGPRVDPLQHPRLARSIERLIDVPEVRDPWPRRYDVPKLTPGMHGALLSETLPAADL